jgi:hypothetical protein
MLLTRIVPGDRSFGDEALNAVPARHIINHGLGTCDGDSVKIVNLGLCRS